VDVPELGSIKGDVAWGGNWCFLVGDSPPYPLELAFVGELSRAAGAVKDALLKQGITAKDGAEIDHIEFFGPAVSAEASSRNFVLCPGGAYDRSPCGTGTSAKLASLAASGKLKPGQEWVQESVIGSRFQLSYRAGEGEHIIPTIRGRGYICSEGVLIRQDMDPYRNGIK
jgi:4-hydroxyproline epimerase